MASLVIDTLAVYLNISSSLLQKYAVISHPDPNNPQYTVVEYLGIEYALEGGAITRLVHEHASSGPVSHR